MSKEVQKIHNDIVEIIERKTVERITRLETKINLNKDFPLFKAGDGEPKPIKYDSGILADYIIMACFEGKFIYKDYADSRSKNEVFGLNNGALKIYNEEKGVFEQLTHQAIKNIAEDYFYRKPQMRRDHKASKKSWVIFIDEIVEDIKNNLNRYLRIQGNHWSDSFEKGYLPFVFKNGTYIFDFEEKKGYFIKEKSPNFLATYYLDADFDDSFLENLENNNLIKFLNFKFSLESNKDKQELFYACLFDLFYTENQSQHALFFTGKAKSGKSTIFGSLFKVKGSDNWLVIENAKNIVDKFVNTEIFNNNIIVSDETSEAYLSDTFNFKNMLSKGYTSFERKFKDKVTIKFFSKFLMTGEKPLEMKIDGGIERRFIYFMINPERMQIKGTLEKYLRANMEKNLFQVLLIGFYSINKNNFLETLTSLRDRYEELYKDTILQIGKLQTSHLEKMEELYVFKERSCITFSDKMGLYFGVNVKDKGNTQRIYKDYLKDLINKTEDFKGLIIGKVTSDINVKKIRTYGEYKNLPKLQDEDDKDINKKVIFKKNTTYILNVGLNTEFLKSKVVTTHTTLLGQNSVEKIANAKSLFRDLEENEYKCLLENMEILKL
jgi:hypothetical protein